ncbi:hypothetical protein B1C78_14050 [Thioalkalivibrio denitrificans]|uniref:PqqD family protein n=1 Tax=Thioalkalivibrio denitrificans TaxID=108003 RepID=A0A1V3NCX8_9GAMM|nr:PqqD family protein [Thioalkalivibrio denitrificans]OOG22793.1 hypothetical protein B1C78_14050 [Thioalkalivibrio denitrificans]
MRTDEITTTAPARTALPLHLPFRRNPSLEVHRVDAGLLLVDPATGTTRRLDPLEAGIWYLLKDPTTVEESVLTLQRTCPDRDPARIRHQVEQLFRDLLSVRMILGE